MNDFEVAGRISRYERFLNILMVILTIFYALFCIGGVAFLIHIGRVQGEVTTLQAAIFMGTLVAVAAAVIFIYWVIDSIALRRLMKYLNKTYFEADFPLLEPLECPIVELMKDNSNDDNERLV